MIEYTVVHHIPGRIRLKVPSLKGKSIPTLMKLSTIPLPSGVIDVQPNPFTGNILISYDAAKVDIMTCLREFASKPEVVAILGG
jgi:hypothetical protein